MIRQFLPLLFTTVILIVSGHILAQSPYEENAVLKSVVSVQLFIHFEKWHWYRRWDHICEGVIVTRSIIVTACRCMMDNQRPPKLRASACKTRVEAGNQNLNTFNKYRQVRRVREFIPHSKCGLEDSGQWHHDVGLMVLQYDLIFNQQTKPAKLFNRLLMRTKPEDAFEALSDLQEESAQCYSSGWLIHAGDQQENIDADDEGLEDLRRRKDIKLHLLEPDSCREKLCSVSESMCLNFDEYDPICAFRLGSVCSELSGGPLFCENSFLGTVSNRTACGIDKPLVFTSIIPILTLLIESEEKFKHRGINRPPGYVQCKEEAKEIEEVQPGAYLGTTTPEAKKTTTSEIKATTTPEAKKTTTPEAKKTTTPEAKKTTTPRSKATATPKAKKTTTLETTTAQSTTGLIEIEVRG